MESLWRDLRYAFRSIGRNPAFASVAVVSLALGIGANTTIFTLINAVFLNPIQAERPQELVAVFTIDENNPGQFTNMNPVSFPNFEDFRDQNEVFTDVVCYSFPFPLSVSLRGEEPEQRFTEIIDHRYFDLLGVRMQLGRAFLPEEDATPSTHPVAVMSDALWKREFAASPTVVGQVIRINGLGYTVVGVAPERFRGLNALIGPELWVPTMMHAQILPAQFKDFFDDRRALFLNIAARLRPGITQEQAAANLKTIAGRLEKEYPKVNNGRSVALMPLMEATIFPGIRQILLMGGVLLMTVVGLVLLIACSNVANLLLARAAARRKEIAIRLALGAGRRRLVQQLLTEAIVLGLLGGAAGLLVARWGRDFIWSFRPAFLAQNFLDLTLDSRVLLFTLVISGLTGVLFGLAPALQISRPNLVGDLADAMNLYVASLGEPGQALTAAHREILVLDREMPTPNVWTITQVIDQSLWPVKLGAGLLAVMGLLALALAAVGLYGVMGYWVNQHDREIGIRMAIGASQPDVLKMVLQRGMTLVAIGLGLGMLLSLGVSQTIASILYGSATDPVTFIGVPILLCAVALVASFIPAYRASRVDPLIALRQL